MNALSRHSTFLFQLIYGGIKMTTAHSIEISRATPINFGLANALRSDIKYKLFTRPFPDGVDLTQENISSVNIDVNLPTKVFIHGWNSNLKNNWYNAFKDEYLKKRAHNIIYVDWFEPGSKEYSVSAANVKPVGSFIGDFILASEINLDAVHVIGKSLGAHVASYVGKQVQTVTNKKLGRITALDPASPKFENDSVPSTSRLNETDAQFIDVIHTDIGFYGFIKPLGTVDFYPNGGGLQPGCQADDDGHNDSHGRSNWYFLETINNGNIKAWKSPSWEEFLKGNKADEVVFGEDVSMAASGSYYFRTNATKPYTIINE